MTTLKDTHTRIVTLWENRTNFIVRMLSFTFHDGVHLPQTEPAQTTSNLRTGRSVTGVTGPHHRTKGSHMEVKAHSCRCAERATVRQG